MIEFQNCEVVLNEVGLMAQSASLGTTSPISPIYALGRRGTVYETPVGQLTNSLNISYIPETVVEPNLDIIAGLRAAHNDFHYQPITGAVCGVSGYFYLQSYNLRSSPNEPNRASATYVSYQLLSGSLLENANHKTYDTSNSRGVMHGWATTANITGSGITSIQDFEYDFRADWVPVYSIGSVYPTQVQLAGGTETISFVREVYNAIAFSGENSITYMGLNASKPNVLLTGLSTVNGITNGNGYNINCSGQAISNEISAVVNDSIKVKSTIVRHF